MVMGMRFLATALWVAAVSLPGGAQVERVRPGGVLDPSRAVKQVRTVWSFHAPLPEEYVWTADDAAVATGAKQLSQLKRDDWKVAPHDFRGSFAIQARPRVATLYVAGPRSAKVWINGVMVAPMHFAGGHHMGFGTMSADVSSSLRTGRNVIAIEAVRGFGSHHHTNALKTSWLNSGEVLVAKIVPAGEGMEAPALAMTDASWKNAVEARDGWQQAGFDDSGWKRVTSLGGIESSIDFFQWNADAGMYGGPGYLGEAPYMANYRLDAVLTKPVAGGVLLDFGRELNGRIVVQGPATATVRMGESMGELRNAPYLGEIALTAPAGGEARGPKTGFRYALVKGDAKVQAEGIYYPVAQVGTFESNDARVNRIFETAVYTAHLSLQDSTLDGIKRDRGRWIGDDEVIDRVAMDVFGETRLVKEGLEEAIGPAPVKEHVNGLPGYSAWWVVAEWEYVHWSNDLEQLRAVTPRMLQLLEVMERELDARKVYVGASGGKPFVDWAPGFSADSPEARKAVHYESMRAFSAASALLQLEGRNVEAEQYNELAKAMKDASVRFLQDGNLDVGDRWQTNVAAVLASERLTTDKPWLSEEALWRVLGRAVDGLKPTDVITPYYGSCLLDAMWATPWPSDGLRQENEAAAMTWLKSYWGGMLDNGATSFWEAWDPRWAGADPHAKLEADDKVGYNASLAHGWSSGPAAFLLERVLGVTKDARLGNHFLIEPRLAGLQWVKGTVATVAGPIRVEASETKVRVVLPAGTDASLDLPGAGWSGDGIKAAGSTPARSEAALEGGRSYEFTRN
jgi:alpha-L-rhamnosidase